MISLGATIIMVIIFIFIATIALTIGVTIAN